MNAKAILEAKLALEDELIGPLSYVLSGYMEGWVKADGQMHLFDQVAYRGRIESVLIRHYARVISVLSGIKPTSETTIDQVALGPAHAERMTNRAHNQAKHMVRGMERDLVTILAMMPAVPHEKRIGEIETKKDKLTVSIAGRFKETAKQAWNKLKARLRAIANVETQGVAEEYQIEWVKQQHANSRVYKQWHNSQDERVRGNPEGRYANSNFDHWVAEGIEVPVNEPFIVSGEELMFPGDGGRGASLGNIINCFPGDTRVSGAVLAVTRHWFEGEVVEVTTRGGHKLSGTPNHPVLTAKGWVALGALNEGDDLIRSCDGGSIDSLAMDAIAFGLSDAHDVNDIEPTIEQVFDTLAIGCAAVREVGLTVDFHGDIPTHDVDVVRTDRVLWQGADPVVVQKSHEFSLRFPDFGSRFTFSESLSMALSNTDFRSATGNVRSRSELLASARTGFRHASQHALSPVARFDASVDQGECDFSAGDAKLGSDGVHGSSGVEHLDHATSEFSTDCVINVTRRAFSGHVFNLETAHGLYHANGFVVHNCRCSAHYLIIGPNGERIDIPLKTPVIPAKRRWHQGDRLGVETPVRATEAITMTGRTRANIVLGDGRTFAVMQQVAPDTVVIRANGQDLARATFSNGVVTSMTTVQGAPHLDLEGIIRRSVEASRRLAQ